MTYIIDGNAIADQIAAQLKARIDVHVANGKPSPKMAIVIAKDFDPASANYVGNKIKRANGLGVEVELIEWEWKDTPEANRQADLMKTVSRLNEDGSIAGFMVQSPLPEGIEEQGICEAIKPEKDIDGFHSQNLGSIFTGTDGLKPCTALATDFLVKVAKKALGQDISMRGDVVGIIGKSNKIGASYEMMARKQGATIVGMDSATKDMQGLASMCDVLVPATGVSKLVTSGMVKEGAIIIDVGIAPTGEKTDSGRMKFGGDVDHKDGDNFKAVSEKAAAITPVPGGVGPMTVIFLASNALKAYESAIGIDPEAAWKGPDIEAIAISSQENQRAHA